jgi:AcrR family transcriptional regulator
MRDRRSQHHEDTREEILAAAWRLARSQGLTGWSLRELAEEVGMRAPSLYVYFDRKDAIYDAMFAQGYRELLEQVEGEELTGDARAVLRRVAAAFFSFFVADPARHQLLFLRVIPGFAPSPDSYAVAEEVLDRLRVVFADLGLDQPEAIDLWTALLTGLATQQFSNEPGGDRWARLIDPAVEMFLAAELTPGR